MLITKRSDTLRLLLSSTLILIGLCYYGCRKDSKTNPQTITDPAITQAQKWYNDTYPVKSATGKATLSTNTDGTTDLSQYVKPDWGRAKRYTRFNEGVIEIPVDPASQFSMGLKNTSLSKVVYKNAYSRSYFLLLGDSSNYQAYLMTVIADSAYVKNDLTKLTRNTYSKRDSDFSGMVLYYTPKGKYVSGYVYKNGQVLPPVGNSGTGTTQTQSIKKPDSEQEVCDDYWAITYTNGRVTDVEYLFTVCGSEDDGSGGGGSAGGSAGGGGTPSNSPPNLCATPGATQSIGKQTVNSVPANLGTGTGSGSDTGFAPPCPAGTSPSPYVPPTPVDPCAQKKTINATQANTNIQKQNAAILAEPTNLEYGTEQNLTSIPGSMYENTLITPGTSTSAGLEWDGTFSWNSSQGYTIGLVHDHPDGEAPSPADIFAMMDNLTNPDLDNAGSTAINYYKTNASITILTNTTTYVITVSDWGALQSIENTYLADKDTFNDTYASTGAAYNNKYPGNVGNGGVYALTQMFDTAINIYQAPKGSTTFTPLTLNSNNQVTGVSCPN